MLSRCFTRGAACLFICSTLLALPAVAEDRYAIVIGSNAAGQQHAKDYPPLLYAADDAAKMHWLLLANGFESQLYASDTSLEAPDTHRRSRFEQILDPRPTSADRSILDGKSEAVHGRIVAAIRQVTAAVKAKGRPARLLLYYSGHGDADALYLRDKPLTFAELGVLLGESKDIPGFFVDVIVDACLYRSDPASEDAVSGERALASLSRDGHVGVMLGATRYRTTLEWESIASGVLTYVYSSGLLGAATIVGSRADYDRIAAYVETAFLGVTHPGARISPIVSPHKGSRTLIDWSDGKGDRRFLELIVPKDRQVRLRVFDGSQAPLFETHLGTDREDTVLRLPAFVDGPGRPSPEYLIEESGGTVNQWRRWRRYRPKDDGVRVTLDALAEVTAELKHKGRAEEASLREGLFSHPFDNSAYLRHMSDERHQMLLVEQRKRELLAGKGQIDEATVRSPNLLGSTYPHRAAWTVGVCTATAALAAFGLVANRMSSQAYRDWGAAKTDADYTAGETRTRRWEWTALLSFGSATASGLGCGGLLLHSWLRPGVASPSSPGSADPPSYGVARSAR